MADRDLHRIPLHHQQQQHRYPGGMKQIHPQSGGPTKSQILAVVTLLPVTGTLLGLAGITLAGTLIALTIATPLFVIFSPILVPAALLLAGAVTAFLTSGAFGLTGLSSITWLFNSFRQTTGQQPLEYVKHKVQEATVEVGEKTKQMGETIKSKAQPAEGGAQGKESAAAK